jgi:hypothetical protein
VHQNRPYETNGKLSSLTANFLFRVSQKKSFWRGHGEISSKQWLMPKDILCSEFSFNKLIEFPTIITHKSPTVWSHVMDHWKAERVSYCNGIRDFQIFGQFEAQKFSSVQLLFCPETEFSSEVDIQNSVTSKPFAWWSWIRNRWKAVRVTHLFAIQL